MGSPHRSSRRLWLIVPGLLALVAIVYWEVPSHPFVAYDDPKYVTHNEHILEGLTGEGFVWAFTSGYPATWHPLALLSHMADVSLFGVEPRGHHLMNVLLHAAGVVLLFLLLVRSTGAMWRSAFVAAVFAAHPLSVEPVAWVSSRKDVLSMFWMLLTLHAYLTYVRRGGGLWYGIAILAYVLAAMSKPIVATLPLIMALLDYWPLARFKSRGALRRIVLEKVPFILVGVLALWLTYHAQATANVLVHEAPSLGARSASGLSAYAHCLSKVFWPTDLAALYPLPPGGPDALSAIAGAVLLVVVTTLAVRRRTEQPYLAVGWLWFVIAMLPVAGFVRIGMGTQAFADRFAFFPSLGIYLAVAWGATQLLRKTRPQLGIGLACIAVALLAFLARAQSHHWKSNLALFGHAARVTTGNYVMHTNYGAALMQAGELDAAKTEFEAALRIKESHPTALFNLGRILVSEERFAEALPHLSGALAANPSYVGTLHYMIGVCHVHLEAYDQARAHLQATLGISPDHSEARELLQGVEAVLSEQASGKR